MGIKFTEDQEKAINEKGNILVAAAAGSGKTAVLVERVIRNILEKGMNIDEMLVVTFTKAAATEMREKILDAIYKKMEESKSSHLSKQILLLNKANISTIHSFCFNIIKENFYILGISPDSIVGKTEELAILKQESIDEVFDKWYEKEDPDFNSYIFNYAGYRDDEDAKNEILKFYNFLTTIPFKEDFEKDVKNFLENKDFLKTDIFKDFISEFKKALNEDYIVMEKLYNEIKQESEFLDEKAKDKAYEFIKVLDKDLSDIKKISEEENWDNLVEIFAEGVMVEGWPRFKVDIEDLTLAKDTRNKIKDNLKDKKEKYFNRRESEIYEENLKTKKLVELFFNLALDFEKTYTEKKKKEKILDFSDLERYALKILIRRPENEEDLKLVKANGQNVIDGKYLKTDEAIKLTKRFKEIQIDEYQDINTIQEYILNSVSNLNAFQVGDIKQSIYMFRNANPNLFLKKYSNYKKNPVAKEDILGQTIKLFKNFRSRSEVLDYTNLVFSKVMSKELGDVEYKEDEYLNLGFKYEEVEDIYSPEITYIETHNNSINTEELDKSEIEAIEDMEKIELESIYIKNKIKEIISNKMPVYDKKQNIYRPITYKDIAIILRTKKNKTTVIEKILNEAGIPVYNEESEGYLNSVEVSKVLDYLKIIDNPYLDIELLSILRSYFWNFTLSDITEIIVYQDEKGTFNPNKRIYEKLKEYSEEKNGEVKNKELLEKTKNFINTINMYQDIAKYYNTLNLIYKIIYETGYIDFVLFQNNGNIKALNLKLFIDKAFEYEKRGITNIKKLVSFLEKVEIKGDEESAKLIGEDEDVVRIMTMHKSKGLEFPIVFLPDLGKGFNEKDLTNKIIYDEKLGIAAEYSDLEHGIRYSSVLQNIFKTKIFRNLVSEELRILYVALTRAREKLYLVGCVKEYSAEMEKIAQKERMYLNTPNLSKEYIKSNKSFLNILTIANNEIKKDERLNKLFNLKTNVETKESLNLIETLNENKKDEELKEKILEIKNFNLDDTEKEKYKDEIEYVKNIIDSDIEKENITENEIELFQKMSVSKITQGDAVNFERPKIMSEEKLSGKERGDIIHNIFKNLDFRKTWGESGLYEYLSNLNLGENEFKVVDKTMFSKFLNSDIYGRIKDAKEIKKEENFYFTISKNELMNFLNNKGNKDIKDDENILIQGVIDLYFIDRNDNIVLIDYKTDSGSKDNLKEMLVKNYGLQLKLYSLVLEKLYGKKVDEIYIYSTKLNEFIRL